MNRRNFLKKAVVATAALATIPLLERALDDVPKYPSEVTDTYHADGTFDKMGDLRYVGSLPFPEGNTVTEVNGVTYCSMYRTGGTFVKKANPQLVRSTYTGNGADGFDMTRDAFDRRVMTYQLADSPYSVHKPWIVKGPFTKSED